MSTVLVEPSGISLEVADGETLFDAAGRAGLRWPNVCGGKAVCRGCWFEVLEASPTLGAAASREAQALKLLVPTLETNCEVRLACQIRPQGQLVVRKIGVRRI